MHRSRRSIFEVLENRTLLAVTPLDIGQFKGRPGQFGSINGTALFTTTDFPNGQLLWATDGTAQGTRLVKDLDTAPSTGGQWFINGRDNALAVGNTFYFTGVDNAHGRELWASDGTPAGTRMLADLARGEADSNPEGFVALGNQLLFTANKQLWRTDGTAAGTRMLLDADPLGHEQPERMAVRGSFAYFTVYPGGDPHIGVNNTGGLWRTDGTARGTVLVRDVSPQPFDPIGAVPSRSHLINVGNTLYFTANDGTNGFELWRSDGTKKGTVMVRDLMTGGATPALDGSYPSNLTDVNGTLYFSAVGFLWKTDGTRGGTMKLKTVAQPRGFVNVNGSLYFVSQENLWKSDGTRAGTRRVAPGEVAERFGPGGVASLNGRLYFGADGGEGFELYETDGTPDRTALVYDAEPGPASSHAQVLGRAGERIIFTARGDATAAWQTYAMTVPEPHRPRDLRLASESDTGASDADRLTGESRPTVTGTAPPDALVRLFADGIEVGSTFARGGAFAIAPNVALPDGTRTLTATARDDVGRTSAVSQPLSVTIDTSGAAARFKVTSPRRLELRFSEDVRATLAPDDLTLHNMTTGETVDGSGMHVEYVNRTNTAVLTFPNMASGLTAGDYRLTVSGAGVTDAAGNAMPADAAFRFAPTGGLPVSVARGVFIVTGTSGNDAIIVRRQAGSAEMLEVGLNGTFTRHPLQQVRSVRVDAMAGDDVITFDQTNGLLKLRSSIYAGDGNDTVTGGAHRDRVYAGAGDDSIDGNGGHDVIYGDAGNDTLVGARGDDYLVGGADRDVIEGNLGTDRLIVETGIDQVMLDANDKVLTDQLA
jgi:ELWxxDGT repeat protein